jgi:hypothetical protein
MGHRLRFLFHSLAALRAPGMAAVAAVLAALIAPAAPIVKGA